MSSEHDVSTFFTEKSKSTATVIKEHGEQIKKSSQRYTDIVFGEISTQLQKLDKLDKLDVLNFDSMGNQGSNAFDTIDTTLSNKNPLSLNSNTAFSINAVFSHIENNQPVSSLEIKQHFDKPYREIERFIRVLIRRGLITSLNGYCEVA